MSFLFTAHNVLAMVVAIPDGDSGLTIPVLRALGIVQDLRVVLLSRSRWASARYSRLTTSVAAPFTPDAIDPVAWMERWIGQSGADVVLPIGLAAVEFFSVHGIRGVGNAAVAPIPTIDAFRITSCKRAFAQWVRGTDVPVPPTLLGEEALVPGAVEEQLGFPVLVKPRLGMGGAGIRLCRSRVELESILGSIHPPRECIVQRHFAGHDWGCNVLCNDGEICAATVTRLLFGPSNPYGPGEGVEFVDQPEILDLARNVMGRLRWTGVANLDLRWDPGSGRFMLLEINPRFWRNTALSALASVNFPHLACLTALGTTFPIPRQRPVRVAKFREAIRRRLRAFISREPHGYDLSEVPMVIADPLPMAAVAARWVARRMGLPSGATEPDQFTLRL